MSRTTMSSYPLQLAGMLAIAAAVGAAFWIADGLTSGLLATAWMLLFVAIVHFGRDRIDAINVISGVGDERTRDLYTRSVAFAGTVTAFVVLGWWLATVLEGDPNETLSLVAATFGVSYIAGAILHSRRG